MRLRVYTLGIGFGQGIIGFLGYRLVFYSTGHKILQTAFIYRTIKSKAE
jgi:hypothetical protein